MDYRAGIIVSFEVDGDNHDRMELAVFNCPEMGISVPLVNVYFNNSFRPDRSNRYLAISRSRLDRSVQTFEQRSSRMT